MNESNSASRPLSLTPLTVLELRPDALVDVAADAGFSHVGLRLVPATPEEIHYSLRDDTRLRRATLRRLRTRGISVLDIEILRLKADTRVDDFRGVLELGAEIGASEVLVAGIDDDEQRMIDNLAALCDLAAPLGLHPHLEAMPWTGVRDLAQAWRIASACRRANAGVLIDPIHWSRSGGSVADVAALPPGACRYAQLCDAPLPPPTDSAEILRQARADRRIPGDGDLDLRGLLAALPPALPLSLEVPLEPLRARGVDAAERARRIMAGTRRLLAEIDAV